MNALIFMPKTSFPMKGKLPQQELMWLEWWKSIDLYTQQRQQRKGSPLFVLHDGPPYANGPIHLGHALNKILKDFVNRWKYMTGHDFAFVPGWDCHGLPIEAKIEEDLRRNGYQKNDVSVPDFRAKCRDFAEKWIMHQSTEFQRLGITGDWTHPYTTMDLRFELQIIHYLFSLVNQGYIYRDVRPVLWSVAEQTALAEAEVEYAPLTSKSVYVRFPIIKWISPEFENACAVIWTTTPWSLPGNRAICYNTCIDYVLYEVKEVTKESLAYVGEKLLVAQDNLETFCKEMGITQRKILKVVMGSTLAELTAAHPWAKAGYGFFIPFLPSEYVETQVGTGLVHTAPGHGLEDFIIGQRYKLEIASPISEEGLFFPEVPLLGGLEMYEAYPVIRENLLRYNALIGENDYTHQYPHSWRSKKPLFYRVTPQWFIALDGERQLRQHALQAIQKVQWYPHSAENRIEAMVRNRPDWCISRQRTWGVPITQFLHIKTGEILKDLEVQKRIEEKIAKEGLDFWFAGESHVVLGENYDPCDWIASQDIMDVWLESGLTHEIVLKDHVPHDMILPIQWPASLYLEGSDQHRAWFQSSLCLSVALENGQPPYESVLTHGFVLDEKGQKMSKSAGNVMAPSHIVSEKGADILRLWVAYEDYQRDLRIGPSILARIEDMYRRFRNTLRYLLGALYQFSPTEYQPVSEMDGLDRWIHHRLYTIGQENVADLAQYHFRSIIERLHLFCSQDLSAFYFDVCKDSLYCDAPSSVKRQKIRTTFFHVLWCFIHWIAPVLCFTAEEAWSHLAKDILGFDPQMALDHTICQNLQKWFPLAPFIPYWSIHLCAMPSIPENWQSMASDHLIKELRTVRSLVTTELEKMREKKEIKSSLQASVLIKNLSLQDDISQELCATYLGAFCLVSDLSIEWSCEASEKNIEIIVYKALGEKCVRCWRVLAEVIENPQSMCQRCQEVILKHTHSL